MNLQLLISWDSIFLWPKDEHSDEEAETHDQEEGSISDGKGYEKVKTGFHNPSPLYELTETMTSCFLLDKNPRSQRV